MTKRKEKRKNHIVVDNHQHKRSMRTGLVFILISGALTFANAQEYTYDANGNLKTDGNKQISSIHYNFLNLVDTITYADARKMIYTYTATGRKLREQSINADGTTLKKRDYDHQVLYTGNVLREIRHEEGRLVPVTPGNSSSPFDYQYHLNDHLGNVRSMITSSPGTNNNIAAFETSSVNDEQSQFTGYDKARRINSILFDHTKKGITHYSQRLTGLANEKHGIAKSLSVMPGDTVKLETYAKYVDPNKNNLTAALTTMLSQIATGAASTGTVIDGAGYAGSGNTPLPFAGLNNTSDGDGKGPKAYMNWLVFDRNFVFKTGGHVKMSEAGKENGSNVKHEKLEKQLIITQPGYVYAYLSNEETTPVDVYFDDFSVTQANGPVIQQTDYDPFGLTFNEYARENSAPNDFLYNGKEQQKDFDLNWYDYGARMYDAALGRWHVIDPLAEKFVQWSPYNYVMNNPVKLVDPDGKKPIEFVNDSKEGEAAMKIVVKILAQLKTGKRIVGEVAHNREINVYVTFQTKGGAKFDGGKAIGTTYQDVRYRIDGRKEIISNPVAAGTEHEVFQGKDITQDLKSSSHDGNAPPRVYTVAVGIGDPKEMAETILHELEAHINIRERAEGMTRIKLERANCGCDQQGAEHNLFGSSHNGGGTPGSTAETVRKELADLKMKE